MGLTYLKEHEVYAWHRHDTKGKFESVCVIDGGDEDRAYFEVCREVNGRTKRYIEYFAPRDAFLWIREFSWVPVCLIRDLLSRHEAAWIIWKE